MSSDKLIIYLQDDEISHWGILHTTNTFERKQGDLAEISNQEFSDVIVIAPPTAILLLDATLPKMSKPRLLQALPFALEEQVLTDIADLHFALPTLKKFEKADTEITLPVAIIAREKLTKWIQDLNAKGIYPTSLLPAPLLLNIEENCWSVFVEEQFSMLRSADFHASTCDTINLNEYLSFKLRESTQKPQAIYIYNFTEQKINLNLDINVIEKNIVNDTVLDYFAKNISKPNINLLQGLHQAKRKNNYDKKIWKMIPALAAAWVCLILFSNSISYFALHHKDVALQNDIRTIYKENFPKSTSVVAVKQRMTDKLKSLTTGGQKNHFLAWLSALGETAAGSTDFQIKQMDYRNNALSLQFTSANFATVDNIIKNLIKHGINAKQENVAQAGTQVKGILVISEGNSS